MLTVIDDQHTDATRPEPPGGASREEWIKARLKTFFRDPVIAKLVTREEAATGPALSQFFTDYLDIKAIFAVGAMSAEQRRILWFQYGPDDLLIGEVADRMDLDRGIVYRERHTALEYLCRIYFDEPDYCLPARTQVRAEAREQIADYLRGLEWD